MKRRKILIVSASFFPENSPRSFRTTELAKEFSRQGHDVTVYIPDKGEDYTALEKQFNFKIKNFGALYFKAIILTGNGLLLLVKRAIRRGLQLFFEWPDIELMFKVSAALKAENGYDILLSIAVPHPIHWGVARSRKKNRRIADCWIADCGDPYMGETTDSFRKLFYFKYVEKWFCRKADYITIPFEGARSAYFKEFHDKIRIIPQGFQLDHLQFPEFKKTVDYPIFAYAGGFIPGKRDPGPLLDFLAKCDRKFKFVIYTSQENMLNPAKEILKEKLEIRSIIPREELLTILAGMDFLVNFDNNTHTQLPSKLIDYSITGRPVININASTDFSVILEFIDGNYINRMQLGSSENYDIKVVTREFINLSCNI